jgi:hypothetical protein
MNGQGDLKYIAVYLPQFHPIILPAMPQLVVD